MRGERRELALQLVQPPKLSVRYRLLQEGRDQRPEGAEQVELGGVEVEALAALVAGHEAQAAPLA